MKILSQSEGDNSYEVLDFCEALLYYADTKMLFFYSLDKSGHKKKITPERFDWTRSKKVEFKSAKAELLSKF